MTGFEEVIADDKGNRLDIGTRVKLWDDASSTGVVVEITECDDAGPDDEGRSMPVYPRVYVHWDGEAEREAVKYGTDHYESGWSTSFEGQEYDDYDDEGVPQGGVANFVCDELEVVR